MGQENSKNKIILLAKPLYSRSGANVHPPGLWREIVHFLIKNADQYPLIICDRDNISCACHGLKNIYLPMSQFLSTNRQTNKLYLLLYVHLDDYIKVYNHICKQLSNCHVVIVDYVIGDCPLLENISTILKLEHLNY